MKRRDEYSKTAVTLLVLLGIACSNEPGGPGGNLGPIGPSWSCVDEGRRPGPEDLACADDKRFVKGDCAELRCDAGPLAPNCCPGLFCTAGGTCEVSPARSTPCTDNSVCDPGMFCFDRPLVNADAKTCGFLPVDATGGCPQGGQPFGGRCVVDAPCGNACNTGTVCNLDTNKCEVPPNLGNADHGCDQGCTASEILIYEDPDLMLFAGCCKVTCVCATLPPLEPGTWGRFSDVAAGPLGQLSISAYDATYGDLVVATASSVSGNIESLVYVDGVPSGPSVVADPNGPRGGHDEPGADVGQYTSIALAADGSPRIAYYDVEARDLKFAAWDLGAWSISVIDDSGDPLSAGVNGADVGRYVSLVIDPNDVPHVSYFATRVQPATFAATTPMYARATSPLPDGLAAWDRIAIDPVRACTDLCRPDQACVMRAGTPTCVLEVDDPGCSCTCEQSCVDPGTGATCELTLPKSLGEPCDGDCPTGTECAADASGGTECYSMLTDEKCDPNCTTNCPRFCGAFEICVDDGAPVCRLETPYSRVAGLPKGVGLFTSLVLHDDMPTVVYYDRVRRHLRGAVAQFVYDAPSIAAGFALPGMIACDPLDDRGQHASLAVAPDDSLGIALQGAGGETLIYYATTGTDLFTGTDESVDDGIRGTRINLVGAGAELVFDTAGTPLIAYADQTDNDLLVAYKAGGAWKWIPGDPALWPPSTNREPLLFDGAYGGAPNLVIDGTKAFVSNYLRERQLTDQDTSRLVIVVQDISALP